VKSVVVYGSRSGNTKRVAESIAAALGEYGPVRILAAEDASATVWDHCDLLIVGGPTEGRHATPPVHAFFDRLPAHALRDVDAAAFDTRLDWPRLITGSAAADVCRWLRASDARVVVPAESFAVSQKPGLKRGELERAPIWARQVAESVRPAMVSLAHHRAAA